MANSPGGLRRRESDAVIRAARSAAERFPWYAHLLAESAFDGADCVPVLPEADLAATYYADDTPTAVGELQYRTSGTSTGASKRVRWPRADHERYLAARARVIGEFLGDSCETACADLGTGHAAASAPEVFARLGLRGSAIDVAWPVERHVEILRRARPDFLFTMPMILEHIVAAGGPGYVPRRVAVLGDLAPPEWRRAIAGRIGMDPGHILDLFGSIEVGAIAYSVDAIGGYLFHDHIVPEVIDPADGRPAASGLLLLTSLERDGFPAIRYASGDIVEGFGRTSRGGRPGWRYEHHLGRLGGELKHGEMLSLHAISVAMAALAPGVAWDVRRSGLEVIIGIDQTGYSDGLASAVRVAVRSAHPPVDHMIASRLVGDIGVEPKVLHGRPLKRMDSMPVPVMSVADAPAG